MEGSYTSDNIAVTPGSGATIAAEDVGGVLYQQVKVNIGGDGVATQLVGGAGAVAAGVQRVTLASDDPAVTDLAAIEVLQTSIDGKITACNTGAIAGTVTANAGTNLNTSALALETGGNLATIAGDTTSLDTKITACNTGAVVLAAGTAAFGKLAANSGVDIGDVDVTSSALPTGASTEAKQPALGTAGTASTDVITVQGIASMTPVTVDLGANNDVTVTNATAANCKVEATIAAAQTIAVTNAGTFATQVDGDALTALQLIDNCISGSEAQVDVVAALPTGTNTIGAVKRDVINYTAVWKYYSATGATTDGIVWSPAAGKKWVITDITLTTSAAATVTLEEDKTGGDSVVMAWDLAANGGVSWNLQTPIFGTEDDADLIVTTSAGNIKITVSGYEID